MRSTLRPAAFALASLLALGGCDATTTGGGFALDPIDLTYDFTFTGAQLADGSQEVSATAINVADEIEAQGFSPGDVVAARVQANTAQMTALAGTTASLNTLDRVRLFLGGGGDAAEVASATLSGAGSTVELDVEGTDIGDLVEGGLVGATLRVEDGTATAGATYRVSVRTRLLVEVEG